MRHLTECSKESLEQQVEEAENEQWGVNLYRVIKEASNKKN